MKIDKIAQLAKLELNYQQKERMQQEMEKIIGWIDNLSKVDVSSVEPTYNTLSSLISAAKNTSNQIDRDLALGNAFNKDDAFFLVPNIINK